MKFYSYLIIGYILFALPLNGWATKKIESNNVEKPKYMWFDAEANFERFTYKDSICYYLDKTKEAGFNQIVVDVRPIQGDVLYRSSFMTPLTRLGDKVIYRDWDYLQFFIDEAKKRDLKVSVSATIFPAGRPSSKEGMVYRTNLWKDKTSLLYTPDKGMLDVKDDPTKVAAFLNPVSPGVQDFCLAFIREIVQNYDFDGFALDYCRYSGVESDFSETSQKAFEKYIGKKVKLPEDAFVWEKSKDGYTKKMGKYGKEWFEFRAMVIHDFIQKARNEIKSIKPNVKLEYWTASWYGALYQNGQNWASKKYDPSADYDWASPGYKNSGFADLIDVFMCGTYLNQVYGKKDPESIEYGLERGKEITAGDNTFLGSIYALNYKDIDDAAYVSLTQSDGLVVFDIVQVIEYNLWNKLKKGIDKAQKVH